MKYEGYHNKFIQERDEFSVGGLTFEHNEELPQKCEIIDAFNEKYEDYNFFLSPAYDMMFWQKIREVE